MTSLDEKILETITDIVEVKASTNRFPTSASLVEIMNSIKIDVMEAINGLYRQGKISWYENINGIKMFTLK